MNINLFSLLILILCLQGELIYMFVREIINISGEVNLAWEWKHAQLTFNTSVQTIMLGSLASSH